MRVSLLTLGINLYFWELIIKEVFLFSFLGKKMLSILNNSQHMIGLQQKQSPRPTSIWYLLLLKDHMTYDVSKPKQRIVSTAYFEWVLSFSIPVCSVEALVCVWNLLQIHLNKDIGIIILFQWSHQHDDIVIYHSTNRVVEFQLESQLYIRPEQCVQLFTPSLNV